ncbi:RE2 [Symbiodinium sp. CCMP2456]|nr:RE2 [Symbiodinium sp. CCMP2456]
MADSKDEGASAWYRVPTWDGSPLTWRSFRREMDWWVSSLDLDSTRKYNLAARWLLRQSGPVRQRGEEFSPKELEYQPEMRGKDGEGNDVVIINEDLLAGLNKLLNSLEEINGRTVLDKRGELRNLFYQQLVRKPGERVSEFCSRFRTVVADLKQEGVKIPDTELGWFLREKIGLDPLRKQLLDTALSGKEEYNIIEAEILRLFKDLHASDPLFKKPGLKFFGARRPASTSLSSSAASSRPTSSSLRSSTGRFTSAPTTPRPFFRPSPGRQANVAETEEDEAETEDADDDDVPAEEDNRSLEEVLQTEAEALAAEIEELAEDGADDELIGGLEASVEAGAEALVSMREARSRLQQVRKDRGCKAPEALLRRVLAERAGPQPTAKLLANIPASIAGSMGTGLGTLSAETLVPASGGSLLLLVGEKAGQKIHEAMVLDDLALDEALAHGALVSSSVAPPSTAHLDGDGIGALDSACNRTCAGPRWLQNYLSLLESCAPEQVRGMVRTVTEKEAFKFGNGGVTPSYERWRLPGILCGRLFAFWVSIVPVPSLGLVMGRDWMEAVGAVIDFERKVLECRRLFEGSLELFQLRAGNGSAVSFPVVLTVFPMRPKARDPPRVPKLAHMESARLFGNVVLSKATRRWGRMLQRLRARAQWHIGGVLLWLLQRPSLRYVPLPFPSVSTVAAWKLQAENMVQRRALAPRHYDRALPLLTASRLVEASWLRDRLGLRLAFLEDPLVDGMLAARSSTSRSKSLKAAVLRDQQEEAKELQDRLGRERHRGHPEEEDPTSHWEPSGPPDAFYPDVIDYSPDSCDGGPLYFDISLKDADGNFAYDRNLIFGTGAFENRRPNASDFPGGCFECLVASHHGPERVTRPDEDMGWEPVSPPSQDESPADDPQLQMAGVLDSSEVMFLQEAADYQNEVFIGELVLGAVGPLSGSVSQLSKARGHNVLEGLTLDGGYDFTNFEHQRLALALIRRSKPQFLMISFPCPAFSPLQRLNTTRTAALDAQKDDRVRTVRMSLRLARFATKVAELQLRLGGHFAIENPRQSQAWGLPSMVALSRRQAVRKIDFDMCAFGFRHRKPSRILTSSQVLASSLLGRKCPGRSRDHVHVLCVGEAGRISQVGGYPKTFTKAVISAAEGQFDFDTYAMYQPEATEREAMAVDGELPTALEDTRVEGVDQTDYDLGVWGSDGEDDPPDQTAETEMRIAPAVRAAVYKLHVNTGHRSPARLARALLVCGAPREAVLAAKQLKCSVCAERRAPRTRRPAALPPPRDVGEQAHIDLLVVEDAGKQGYVVVHITDSVSRFQMAGLIEDKSSQSVCHFLKTHWLPIMGAPRVLVCDQGREFVSEFFCDWAEAAGIYLYHIGVQSPWQNGLAERSGGTLKAITHALVTQHTLLGATQVAEAVGEAVSAYNSDINEVALRETARVSMTRLHYSRGLRRASLARARTEPSEEQQPQPGDIVFFYRQQKVNRRRGEANAATSTQRRKVELRRWHGPALLIATEDSLDEMMAELEDIRLPGEPRSKVCLVATYDLNYRGPLTLHDLRDHLWVVFSPEARSLDDELQESRGMKRAASELDQLAYGNEQVHPLLQVQALAEHDRRFPFDFQEYDSGTWDGRWSLPSQREWQLRMDVGECFPVGNEHHIDAVQAARKEYNYRSLTPQLKQKYDEAAIAGWKAYIDNQAVELLDVEASLRVRKDLASRGELDRNLRRDAPTGSRLAQHLLFCIAAYHTSWTVTSADVKSAFLKGDPYLDRELYVTGTDPRLGPSIPIPAGCLARVRKGIFGLADAPREWWLRLSRSLADRGWERSQIDGAMWLLWSKPSKNGKRQLEGVIVAHVDDLLMTGSPLAERSLQAVGDELGFGSVEKNDFVWCGKRIRRATDGTIRLSMAEYHQNLKEINLPTYRRRQLNAKLTEPERRQLRALLGSLQWLTAQFRFDMGFIVSTLQGEAPTVKTVLKANSAVRDFRQDCNFEMIFRPIDYNRGGLVVVSDAALGNVKLNGSDDGTPTEKVFSQACAFVLLADDDLLAGREGKFNVLDARSHRIPRVCRSSYAAETLGAEEAMDMGLLCRGFVASVRDYLSVGKLAERSLDKVSLTLVVDAKDVHDKGNSDTPSYGTQKSLAFVVAWMRAVLRRPNTALRWTATQNMWVDGGTKLMDLTHLRTTMRRGSWSITYSPDFVKQVQKAKRPSASSTRTNSSSTTTPSGEPLRPDDPVYGHLLRLAKLKGWHTQNGLGINVAKNARSLRTPEPRFSSDSLPFRTTFGCFPAGDQLEWRVLERGTKYGALPNQHALIGHADTLITIFHAEAVPQPLGAD